MKGVRICLGILLIILGLASAIAVPAYTVSAVFAVSSFSIVRFLLLGLAEQQYYLILVSVLLCVLILITPIFIYRNRILVPLLSLIYFVYDLIAVVSLSISDFFIGEGWYTLSTHSVKILMIISVITLLSVYCWDCLRKKRKWL